MVTKFKELFPDYNTFDNEEYVMNEVNCELIRQVFYCLLQGVKTSKELYTGPGRLDIDGTIRNLSDIISEYTNMPKTENWGWDFIIRDMEEFMFRFINKPFYKFMDALSRITLIFFNGLIVDEINEILEENKLGYRLVNDETKPWICINPHIDRAIDIYEVEETIEEVSIQAASHIRQAKEQLSRCEDSRARKDAIRDCLPAMETLLKKITDTNSVDNAVSLMIKDSNTWGPKIIVTDGIKMWKLFHEEYRDIRHGDDDISDITLEQSTYFIDRILSYATYLSKIALK